MTGTAILPGASPRLVSLVALPDAVVSTLAGLFDVLNGVALMGLVPPNAPAPFHIEIVGETVGALALASGVPIDVQRSIDTVETSDIVIVPSVLLGAQAFTTSYPAVSTHPERVLVIAGQHEELVSSGASMSWHDLALYLIVRYAGATTAQEVARLFALQWHQDGLTPYLVFAGKTDHGDGEIQRAQQWLEEHFSLAHPVEAMIERSSLAERTFKRRFANATGLTPIAYVQRLRIEDAKRRLERTEASIEEISWRVGYEDSAFFRRLFERTTGLAPSAYRRRFRIPDFARP
ncbi:GlxA family transcriptional regulator [Halomonas sp. MA07-2]|uniref:GlxA family transcriptional regulator n=1 Tax=Halomonas sp. MA07-2 TaxID=3440841 RepID=UPI003EEA2E87